MSLAVTLQKALPQHLISRGFGALATLEHPALRRLLIRLFMRIYDVDLRDAARPTVEQYASFNDFFTRELAPGARPLPADPLTLVSPADGTISQIGAIRDGMLLQAKGSRYSLAELLGDERLAAALAGGAFATVYLAPADYHRVHSPCDGVVRCSRALPGALFSVNARTEAGVPRLFCRNERLVLEYDTAFGPVAVVLVGALIVASIETTFGTPPSPFAARIETGHDHTVTRGAEIGRFLVGSTVIVALPPGRTTFAPGAHAGARIRMGEALASIRPG